MNEGHFLLMMHLTHFIYSYMSDTVKNHSDSERGNPLLSLYGLLFLISSKGYFYMLHRQDSTYHSLCYTSHRALAGMRNSSVGLPRGIDPTTHCTMSRRSIMELHLASLILYEGKMHLAAIYFTMDKMWNVFI